MSGVYVGVADRITEEGADNVVELVVAGDYDQVVVFLSASEALDVAAALITKASVVADLR